MAVLKIAFVGTHGVGKTTLCYELAAYLKKRELRVDMVREVARRCPLPINRDTTRDAQAWILHEQIADEIHMANREDVVICDRSVLDNYAYLVHRLGPDTVLDPLVRAWMRTYTHLFKIPVISPPAFDGTRDTNRTFQLAIDQQVEELIARFQIPIHRLEPRDRPHWIERVAAMIGALPEPPQMRLFDEGAAEGGAPQAGDGEMEAGNGALEAGAGELELCDSALDAGDGKLNAGDGEPGPGDSAPPTPGE